MASHSCMRAHVYIYFYLAWLYRMRILAAGNAVDTSFGIVYKLGEDDLVNIEIYKIPKEN